MYWQGETDAQCSPFRNAASSLLASGEGWKQELIGSSTPTSTLDASHSHLAGHPLAELFDPDHGLHLWVASGPIHLLFCSALLY